MSYLSRVLGIVAAALALFVLAPVSAAEAATVTVTTTADEDNSNPAACSMREAIKALNRGRDFGGCVAANATVYGVNDAITFNIPGGGVAVIVLIVSLPGVNGPVFIDGYSQPGSSPNTNPPTQAGTTP